MTYAINVIRCICGINGVCHKLPPLYGLKAFAKSFEFYRCGLESLCVKSKAAEKLKSSAEKLETIVGKLRPVNEKSKPVGEKSTAVGERFKIIAWKP